MRIQIGPLNYHRVVHELLIGYVDADHMPDLLSFLTHTNLPRGSDLAVNWRGSGSGEFEVKFVSNWSEDTSWGASQDLMSWQVIHLPSLRRLVSIESPPLPDPDATYPIPA